MGARLSLAVPPVRKPPLRPSSRPSASDQAPAAASRASRPPWNLSRVPLNKPDHPANQPADAAERQADTIARTALQTGAAHPLLQQGLSQARFHVGPGAARSAASLDAAAYAEGRDIVFGAGRYRPDTPDGRLLIAHEAVHVGQQLQSGHRQVQRQSAGVVQMPPAQITSGANPVEGSVSNLDRLRGAGVDPAAPVLAHDPADIARNTPDPAARLPFTANGWNGTEILQQLGQYDRMPGTDSDAIRCVQAVGMAARVPDGPLSVTSYLRSVILQGLTAGRMTDRKRTAVDVLHAVIDRIQTQRATFGDLSWAQEAMHDLFYDDVSGTPLPDVPGRIAPDLDFSKSMTRMDVWCDNPQQVMAEAARLQRGEQLVVEEWSVSLDTAFDQLADQQVEVADGASITVNINGRPVRIRRIPLDQRPPHTALDFNRDSRSGHQLLIIKDAASDAVRLYEPETTATGQHFQGLAPDGSNLAGYFQDQPRFGIYHYIEIIGRLTPGITAQGPASP